MSATANRMTYTVKLIRRVEVAERTMAFELEKPRTFAFKAGQFIEMTLTNPPETDAEGNSRAFSIASAPQDDALLIATRLRDTAFKRVLRTLPTGTEVTIEGPFGNLTLHHDATRPAVLLAGGIGITPFRSIVRRAAQEKLPHRLVLIHSNRRPEDAAFLEELQALERDNPKYAFVPTMTADSGSQQSWQGRTGYITWPMVSGLVEDDSSPIYYIAGPPAMTAGLREMLEQAGVDMDAIRTEEFAGY
ncbi:MAG: ferredoxin--NADP reductase [Nitrospiraceae bacterium]